MKKEKSTKMFVDHDNKFLKQIKANADNAYYLRVLYYYVRRALIQCDFNLKEVDGFNLNGRFLGYKQEVLISKIYNTPLKSLSLALSIRAFMLNSTYLDDCYDNRLLFYNLDANIISWAAHQAIMECIDDEEFRLIYEMMVNYRNKYYIDEEHKNMFASQTVRPEYRNQEKYFRSIAKDAQYDGQSVIKDCEYLYADFVEYEIPASVEFVGDTAFAFCQNLQKLKFTRKVLFGQYPIVECNRLRQILVPTEYISYFKRELPYYCDIVSDQEIEIQEMEEVPHTDNIIVPNDIEDDSGYTLDESEIEHVYVDVPSADAYTETEIGTESIIDSPVDKQENTIEPINTKLLDTVFDKKATSYKYFWFLSIMSLTKETNSLTLSYKDIIIRMAAMAWPIIFDYEIELGKTDMLPSYLKDIVKCTKLIKGATSNVVESYLKQHYTSQGVDKILWPLTKNVPYRFLSPWIPFTTNDEVIVKSNDNRIACPYAIHADSIIWDEDWWEYVDSNYNDICNFTLQSFINYVKKDNNQMKLLKLMTEGWSQVNK